MKILVIEDEPKVAAFLQQGLNENGYETDVAYDGEVGKRHALRNDYDMVLLDVVIPHINGVELCRQIRLEKPNIPVLMLTALGTTDDKVAGFDAGADDYLVKPFEFRELLARIKSLTKRTTGAVEASNKIKFADLELDLDKCTAMRGDHTVVLTTKELALLEFFMRNPGKMLTRQLILEKVWGLDFDPETNIVDVYVNILRKKIERESTPKLIHTKIGKGYIFKEPR